MNEKTEKFLTVIGKGSLGAVPFIGSLLSETLGSVIPDRRVERLELLFEQLGIKLKEQNLDEQVIRERLSSIEGIDLLEDCIFQSAKALSIERLGYLAALLKNGITKDSEKISAVKRLLQILGELCDTEVIMLKEVALRADPSYREYYEIHKDVLARRTPITTAPIEEIKEAAILENYRAHLRSLELTRPSFKSVKKGELPEFDNKTGMMKASSDQITILGKLLLETIDELK